MENEVLETGVVDELEVVNKKPTKGMIIGIAAVAVAGVLLACRRKIGAKIEGRMVKKLMNKGYTVIKSIDVSKDDIEEIKID